MRCRLVVSILALLVFCVACADDGSDDAAWSTPSTAAPSSSAEAAGLTATLKGQPANVDVRPFAIEEDLSAYFFPLQDAIAQGGRGIAGTYGDRGEVYAIVAPGGLQEGALVLLVESQPAMPADYGNADERIEALFPAAAVAFIGTPVGVNGPGYASDVYFFQAADGTTTYSLSFSLRDGEPTAFAMAGTGAYRALVPLCC